MWPYGQQPTGLLCTQDSLGKCTGVSCHFIFQLLVRMWQKKETLYTVDRNVNLCSHMKNNMEVSKTRNYTTIWSINSVSGCISKKKLLIWKDACIPMFIAPLFTIVKIWKQPKCPSRDEWIKKMWQYTHACARARTHTHTHTHTQWNTTQLSKEWNAAIGSIINGLGGYCDKWNKFDKDKYCMISIICGI